MGVTKGIDLLLLIALLIAGSFGWGRGIVLLIRATTKWTDIFEDVPAPLQILLGSSLFLFVGGFLVAFNSAWIAVLTVWHVIGAMFLVVTLAAKLRHFRCSALRRLPLILLCTGAAAFAAIVAMGIAIGLTKYNIDDDDASYVYLTRRLIDTGGMLDPFNFRRMTGYGGNLLYQTMFLKYIGNSSIRGFEIVFAALVLILVVVRTSKRRWLVAGSVVISVGVLLGHGIGPIVNLSPEYSITMFSLGAFQLLRVLVRQNGKHWFVISAFIGLFISSLASLRLYPLVAVIIAVCFATFVAMGIRFFRSLAVIGAVAVFATSGWAIALFRSSRSLVFPIFAGNYNSAWSNGKNPAIAGLGQFFNTFVGLFNSNDGGMIIVMTVVSAVALTLVRRRSTCDSLVMFSVATGCLIQVLVFCWILPGSDLFGMTRYLAPSTLACGLFTLDIAWPTVSRHFHKRLSISDIRSGEGIRYILDQRKGISARRAILVSARVLIAVVLLALTSIFTFGTAGFSRYAIQVASIAQFHEGVNVMTRSVGFYDRYSQFRSQYNTISLEVPKRSNVLTAVPVPGLLQFSRFTFATLDIPGAVSPAPHIPLLEGPGPMVHYLCNLNFRYIIAVGPNNPGLYQEQGWLNDLRDNVYSNWDWVPYILGWIANVHQLEQDKMVATSYVGDLALLNLRRVCQS